MSGGDSLSEGFESPPPEFDLAASKFKGRLYAGTKRKLKIGYSMSPEGGREYGIYLTPNLRYAMLYGPHRAKALAVIKRPLVVRDKSEISPTDLTKADVQRLKQQGYDAIVSTNSTLERATEFVLFDRKQVWVFEVS